MSSLTVLAIVIETTDDPLVHMTSLQVVWSLHCLYRSCHFRLHIYAEKLAQSVEVFFKGSPLLQSQVYTIYIAAINVVETHVQVIVEK